MSCYQRAYDGYCRAAEHVAVHGAQAEVAVPPAGAAAQAGGQPQHNLFDRLTNPMAGAFRDYLKDLWTMFSVVNALLIGASMGPFTTPLEVEKMRQCTWRHASTQGLSGKQYLDAHIEAYKKGYGILWTLTLGFNCFALLVCCLMLGSVLAYPPTACQMEGYWVKYQYIAAVPVVLTALGAVFLMLAAAFSATILHCMEGLFSPVGVVVFMLVTMAVCAFLRARSR